MTDDLRRQAQEMAPQLIAWRRHLHAYPELSFQERDTAAFVARHLADLGLTVERPTETGVVATLGAPGAGPTIGIRADIDALPIQEENPAPYASRRPGAMHACGHDGHTAILLGVASLLAGRQRAIPGRVRLIFQPAEEMPPGGAIGLIEAGVLEGVDAMLGLHLWTDIPAGIVGLRSGPIWANADEFKITIRGRGGHGSQPHQTVDALVVAAQVVLNLQTIVSRRVDPRQMAVISIGTLQAGYTFNVIAPTATLTGTVRTYDEDTRQMVRREMARVVEHTCAMAGAEGDFEFFGGYPVCVNDRRITGVVAETARTLVGEERLVEQPPLMGGEDFAYFAQRVPACYVFLGAGNPEKGAGFPHHHPRFDIDEDVLPVGVVLLTAAALRLLTATPFSQGV